MQPAREIELKLELDPGDLAKFQNGALQQRLPLAPALDANLGSVYFDTKSVKLRRSGVSLRIRNTDGRHIQTLKSNGAGAELIRDEWENEIGGTRPEFGQASGKALKKLLKKKLWRKLMPVFETRVRRVVYNLAAGETRIELAVDSGEIAAGARTAPLAEIELELKSGPPKDLFRLARIVARIAPVQIAVTSKADRGYALSEGAPRKPVKALPVELDAGFDAAAAFQAIARTNLRQLVLNRALVAEGDADALHQARVSLRRLRSAISLFSAMLDSPQTERIKTELKWLGGAFGPAREFDVLLGKLPQDGAGMGGMDRLRAAVAGKREMAFAAAREVVEQPRYRALTLDTLAWIESGDWLLSNGKAQGKRRARPIAKHAHGELQRRHARIVKDGRHLRALEPEARHQLRIRVKKLRYACDFFGGAFAGRRKQHNKFVGRLEVLQDALGHLNDIAVNEALIAKLATPPNGTAASDEAPPEAAVLLSQNDAGNEKRLLRIAKKSFCKFRNTKRFWR